MTYVLTQKKRVMYVLGEKKKYGKVKRVVC